jgi:hypothetical protein
MKAYNYAILLENTADKYLAQESTYLDNNYKKTKYAMIEKQVFKDGSEGINRIIYSNNLPKLTASLQTYVSWYNYIERKTKSINQYVSKLF